MKRSEIHLEKLKINDRTTLEGLFKLNEKTLLNTMYHFLNKKYDRVKKTEKYVFAIGDIPITLVAHCDTVFSNPPIHIFYDNQKNVMWSPDGLGADDRAGIWVIIKILRMGYRPHIILTAGEESGGIGARALVQAYPKPFAEMKYIIQLDRRGSNDCVFYDCYNDDFIDYVESFGFAENFGTFSDISVICPHWGIAGVNLSVGYDNEHSYLETLHIGHMNKTIKKVENMLLNAKDIEPFNYVYTPNKYYPFTNIGSYPYLDKVCICNKCNKKHKEYESFPSKMKNGQTASICIDCITNFHWCERCQEPFEPTSETDMLCYDCVNDLFIDNREVKNV